MTNLSKIVGHNITIPCYIECEYDSSLYHKAIKVFSDFGVSLVDGHKDYGVIELFKGSRGALFSDYACKLDTEVDSKQLTEQDLDGYLVMKEKKNIKLPEIGSEWVSNNGNTYIVKGILNEQSDRPETYPVIIRYDKGDGVEWGCKPDEWYKSKTPKVELPEVGSFWKIKSCICKITLVSATGVFYECDGVEGGKDVQSFISEFEPTNKLYCKVNNVWCVAPVEDEDIKMDIPYFIPFRDGFTETYSSASEVLNAPKAPHFLDEDDCEAFEKALLIGVVK